MTEAIVTLLVVATLMELAGLSLLLWALRDTRGALDAYNRWPQTIYLGAAIEAVAAFGVGVITGGKQPTDSERLDALEERVKTLREEMRQQQEKLRKGMTKRMDGIAEAIKRGAADQQERQDAYINAASSPWKPAWGTGLLIAGLLLAAVANILAVTTR